MLMFLLTGFSQLAIQTTDTSQRLTIVMENVQVIEVLQEIEKQSDLQFFYSDSDVDIDRRVSVRLENVKLTTILDSLFSKTTIFYKFSGRYILLINRKKSKFDRQRNAENKDTVLSYTDPILVRGNVVSDDDGEALPGVTVNLKGTSSGVLTNANGEFEIAVHDPARLLSFSFVGYETQEQGLSRSSLMQIRLKPSVQTLSEIVVIGYGTQKRADLTGSIGSVSGQDLSRLSLTSIDQGLQGRLSGVTVTQSASPGGNTSVRIRGLGTIGDNEPLYVIDGVQTTNGLLYFNPGDVETIDVLKDASASAIYGSRAANGVIIVSTKTGKRGSKTKVNFETQFGLQHRQKKVAVLNASQYVQVISESRDNANAQRAELGSALLDPLPNSFVTDSVTSLTDWQDELFHQGNIQNYQLTVSGGNDRTNYTFSGSLRKELGVIINSSYQRYTFRTNVDHDISAKFKIGTTVNFSYFDRHEIPDNDIWNGVLQSAVSMPEMFPVRDHTGNYSAPVGGNSSIYGNARNPVGDAERTDVKNPTMKIFGNLRAEYDILNGLTFKTLFASDVGSAMFKYYQPTAPEGSRPVPVAKLTQDLTQYLWWNWENTLSFARQLGDHEFFLMMGTGAQKNHTEFFSAYGEGFPAGDPESLRYLRYAASTHVNGYASIYSLLSHFGRMNYKYNDKYLLTTTLRRDGSSRFYKDKWGTFPSVSVGWRISEENLFAPIRKMPSVTLRASWGQVGNQSVNSDYPWVTSVGPNVNFNTVLGGKVQPGIAPIQRGNENLTWETTNMADLGADFLFFNGKIGLTVDYFVKDTRNMLIQLPMSWIAGQAAPPNVNAGAVRNKGFELAAVFHRQQGPLTFDLQMNGSIVKNRITDLASVEYITVNNALRGSEDVSRAFVGSPIGSFYGYKTDGIFQSQSEIDAHAVQEPGTRPGDIRFRDIGGPDGVPDGVINSADRTILGDGFPDFTFGLSFTARYRQFDFSLFAVGVSGVQIVNALEYLTLNNQGGNKTIRILDHWSESNRDTDVPRLTWDDPNRNSRISDRYIHDGSYARLKNLQIGYNFSRHLQSISIDHARLYVSFQNLLTLTRYNGFDPEVGSAGKGYKSDLNLGVDQGRYPQPRIFLLGLSMTL